VRHLHVKLQELEHQAALDKERARIARDLHDDLGSCLTKIVMLAGLTKRGRIPPEKASEEVLTMARYGVKSLDETVWAINPRNDTVPAFINYAIQYAADFLRTAGVQCCTDIPDHLPDKTLTAEDRHGLFLVVKEAVNNIVRHAGATEVW